MKKHYIFLLTGLLIGIWFLFFPRENDFTEEYRFEDIFDPRFSGELIHLPMNNHGLTENFIITRHPIAPFPRIENQEPLPQITTGKNIFTYPLERLAFDLSVIKLRGIRHSGFPPYEVDANSTDHLLSGACLLSCRNSCLFKGSGESRDFPGSSVIATE